MYTEILQYFSIRIVARLLLYYPCFHGCKTMAFVSHVVYIQHIAAVLRLSYSSVFTWLHLYSPHGEFLFGVRVHMLCLR
jgi:hypothetical protein